MGLAGKVSIRREKVISREGENHLPKGRETPRAIGRIKISHLFPQGLGVNILLLPPGSLIPQNPVALSGGYISPISGGAMAY
jgi:hypothetical protein